MDSSTETPTNDSGDDASTVTGADLDGAELTASTRGAVESAGSYTLQSLRLQSTSGFQRRSQATTRIDLSANRGNRILSQQQTSRRGNRQATAEVYTANGTSYRQRNSSRGLTYDVDSDGYDGRGDIRPVNVSSSGLNLTFVTDGLVWAENGTTTVDGVNATRYALVAVTESNATITDSSGTLLVDSDNVVRRLSITTTARDGSQTSTYALQLAVTDFGSTTVETPPWLPEARQSASTS